MYLQTLCFVGRIHKETGKHQKFEKKSILDN